MLTRGRHTPVTLHDDPYSGPDALVDKLCSLCQRCGPGKSAWRERIASLPSGWT
jgi:hypothetical protein